MEELSHRLKRTEKPWQMNVMWDPRLDPGTEGGH
jgi:hypothetical protein